MFLLDVIYIPPKDPEVLDTINYVQDSLVAIENTTNTNGGSSLLNWGIPALLAALAACLFFIFKYRRRQVPKVNPM